MSHFHTTRWSIVLQARGNGQDARAALESLCRAYRAPVLAFIRGRGSLVPGVELKYGASVYHNITAGYNIEPLNTRIDVGIDNLTDKQPALIYENNTVNGNVDANTFDTIGRFYWARLTVKF